MGARSGLAKSGEHHAAAATQEPRSQASSEGALSEEGPGGEGRGAPQRCCASFGLSSLLSAFVFPLFLLSSSIKATSLSL